MNGQRFAHRFFQPALQAVAQDAHPSRVFFQPRFGNRGGGPQGDDAGHVFRARPQPSFVPCAVQDRLQGDFPADE